MFLNNGIEDFKSVLYFFCGPLSYDQKERRRREGRQTRNLHKIYIVLVAIHFCTDMKNVKKSGSRAPKFCSTLSVTDICLLLYSSTFRKQNAFAESFPEYNGFSLLFLCFYPFTEGWKLISSEYICWSNHWKITLDGQCHENPGIIKMLPFDHCFLKHHDWYPFKCYLQIGTYFVCFL